MGGVARRAIVAAITVAWVTLAQSLDLGIMHPRARSLLPFNFTICAAYRDMYVAVTGVTDDCELFQSHLHVFAHP
jgi:hypothetical protein